MLAVLVYMAAGFMMPPAVQMQVMMPLRSPVSGRPAVQMQAPAGLKGYFATKDVLLVDRRDEDVAAFHEKERHRWDVVYDEVYVETDQEFYPGDRVKIVGEVTVKDVDTLGMLGVLTHFEFDDGYEACQTCSTSCPVTVLLDVS